MMQSILLTSPVKAQNNERLSDISADEVASSDMGVEEGKLRFADLFDSLLAGNEKEPEKGKEDKDPGIQGSAEQEGEIDSAPLLACSIDPIDSEIVSENSDAELANAQDKKEQDIFTSEWLLAQFKNVAPADNNAAVDADEGEGREEIEDDIEEIEIQHTNFDPSLLLNKAKDKLDAVGIERVDADDTDGQDGQDKAATIAPSILEQIEAAKKIDTQVTEVQKKDQGERVIPELFSQSKTGQEKQPNSINESERPSLKESESDKNSPAEFLKTETAQPIRNKIDPFALANNGETERNAVASPIDVNASRAVNLDVSTLSKSINQHLVGSTPSSALEKPLELQAKHASALLGERILMMIGQGKQEVNIRLDPAELGSMYIKLQVQQDQVHLTIQTQMAQSRDIIEQNLPRLREQLAQQGVSLGETSVEQQSQQQNQNHNHQGKPGVQDKSQMASNDSALQAMGDKNDWIASKITVPAQGIDYYA